MNEGEYGTLMFHGKPIGEIRALRFAEVERRVREASATLETLFVAELRRLVPWDARMWGVLELRACYRNRKGRSAIRRMVRYARRCGFAGLVSVEPLTVAGPYRIEPIDAAAGVVAEVDAERGIVSVQLGQERGQDD